MTHPNSLITKALESASKKNDITDDEIGLAIAWAKGEVSGKQVMAAIGKPIKQSGALYGWLVMRFRAGIVRGMLK
jgi:hypothetical protein